MSKAQAEQSNRCHKATCGWRITRWRHDCLGANLGRKAEATDVGAVPVPHEEFERKVRIRMNKDVNKESIQASPRPICHGCREPVDPKSERALVETIDPVQSNDRKSIAWHQDCFNNFLEAGEET